MHLTFTDRYVFILASMLQSPQACSQNQKIARYNMCRIEIILKYGEANELLNVKKFK